MSASRLRLRHLCTVLLAGACVGGTPSADRELGGSRIVAPDRYEYTAVRMGVAVRVVLYADEPRTASEVAGAGFDRMAVLEAILSDYQPQSELRLLMQRPGEWVEVSDVLFEVLELSLEVARLTDGSFDPTVGPLVALWRRARDSGQGTAASQAERDSARARVDWRKVQLDSSTRSVRLARGMMLDLGGVAKGYILDNVAESFREAGVGQFLIDGGGDIVVGDAPPGRGGWSIAVEGVDREFALAASSLQNAAISTSGGSVQYVELDGEQFSHVIDPTIGTGTTHRNSWHVIHPDAAVADAIATALSASGGRNAAELLGSFPGARAAASSAGARRR